MKRIHLIAPAGGLQTFYRHLGVQDAAAMMSLFQNFAGTSFELSADHRILDAPEDELRGGRMDDEARARDITSALADDGVIAILAVRGGAWFTRILPRIDFGVLDRRRIPITVLGFSELTPLINVVAAHPMGRGIHDAGPAFLVYGLKYAAERTHGLGDKSIPTSHEWMAKHLHQEIRSYFQRTMQIVEGHGEPMILSADLVGGEWPNTPPTQFTGGNLTVLSTLIGSRFERHIDPGGKWLVLEDFNDKVERFDRFLSHFTLAGYWGKCAGLLLGDFHRGSIDLNDAVFEILQHQLPVPIPFPVLRSGQVGHVWPMAALPLNRPGQWTIVSRNRYQWRPAPDPDSPNR